MNNIKYLAGIALVLWFLSFIIVQYQRAKREEQRSLNKEKENEK